MKSIAIIGAGISGLATAKAFLERGFTVELFEKSGGLGGVWEGSRSYLGVATQTTRDEYAFSDFPMPAHYPLWPSGRQVEGYLQAYADQFGITPHIRLSTEVRALKRMNARWRVRYSDATGQSESIFDFAVVCTGTFHHPFVPQIPGAELFKEAGATLYHSTEVKSEDQLRGKRVVVVGFAKSATDLATRAADVGTECHLVYRKAQWKVPRFFGNKLNMKYLLFSRFSEAFFDAPQKTAFQKFLHTAGKPMVWLQWRGLEALLTRQFGLRKCGMRPTHRIEDQIGCSLGVEPPGFYERVRSGAIQAHCTEIDRFEGRAVILKNGARLECDAVVFGTGFRQTLPFFGQDIQRALTDDSGLFRLYRNILPPALPNLAFVGYNSSLFSTLTSEVAAQWLATSVAGQLPMPSREVMEQSVKQTLTWRRTVRPGAAEFGGTCVAPFNFMHLDTLMRDMRLPTRASRNGLREFFKPIDPRDYGKLLKRLNRQPAPTAYPKIAEAVPA